MEGTCTREILVRVVADFIAVFCWMLVLVTTMTTHWFDFYSFFQTRKGKLRALHLPS